MKKYLFLILFSFALSSPFVSCRETEEAVEETGEAVEEGVEEVGENTGIDENDDDI